MFTSFCTAATSILALLLVFLCAVPTSVSSRKQGGSWGSKKCAKAAAKAARKGCSAEASATPKWMFVQTASSCRLRGNRNQLELTTPAATTLAFTDRPVRTATVIDTSAFDDTFDGVFEGSKPNAVLTASRDDGTVVRIAVTLVSPDADGVAGQLTYDISQSAAQAASGSIALAAGDDLSGCSLFIDSLFTKIGDGSLRQSRDPCLGKPKIQNCFDLRLNNEKCSDCVREAEENNFDVCALCNGVDCFIRDCPSIY